MSTYAIGDVQGCFKALIALLDKISFSPDKDTLWFAGDLINRGSDSLSTLRFIYNLSQNNQAITVLGNHDLALLAIAFGKQIPHKEDTYDEILIAPDRDELLHWLRQQPLMHIDETLGYTLVHAGIPPQWSILESKSFAHEVEAILQGTDYQHFLETLFGNTPITRLCYIINALTRMRFCTEDGQLDLKTKSPTHQNPIDFKPWFEWPNKITHQSNILFGHWSALQGKCTTPNIYALDTGCVWGGCLTAFCLETKLKITVNC